MPLRRTTGLLAGAFLLLWASPARSQDPQPAATRTAAGPPNEPLGTLSGTASTNTATSFQALLEGSTDDTSATAIVGWKNGQNQYALTFKAPLSSKTKEAAPLGLDGLNNGASLQFSANHLFWRGPDLDEQAEIIELHKVCVARSGEANCDFETMEPGAERKRLGQLLHLDDIPWYLGVSGTGAVTTYSYINVPDLTAASDTKTDYSVTGRAGFFTSQLGFVIGSAAYQRTSSAGADGVSLCRPVVGTAATSCSDAVLKPPNQSDSYMLSLQLRRALTGDVFVAPAVQHDVRKHVTSVLVPIYFLKDSKGTPIGGLRGGWRSDTHDVSVVLFVGAGFVLTP